MPRGGKRAGVPGRGYSNRTDLNSNRTLPVQAGPSQGYGQQAAQLRSQQAVPMAPPPSAPPQAAAPPAAAGRPPMPVPLDAPTARPGEPLTAGAALGAGPGMEAIGVGGDRDLDELRAIYQRFPSNELRSIIEELEGGD